ncbi:MAG TPA: stage V sporulation protein E [Halanaerobiales bacterium]|nr:stage V sporulation protein E [Halanaerobiales bacterium]
MKDNNKLEKNKNKPDFIILLTVMSLLMIGLIMVFSASSIRSFNIFGSSFHFFKRQLMTAGLGLIAMIITMNIDYHLYKKFSKLILFLTFFLLIIVLIPGIGQFRGGSRRWIDLGFFGFQPSGVAKLGIVIYFSHYLSKKRDKLNDFINGLLPVLIILGLTFLLILLEPDLGTAITIALSAFTLIFVAGARILHITILGFSGVLAILYFIYSSDYRRERFTAFLDPWEDPLDSGYHIIQSLLALGTGGFFGVGIGNSKQKFLYLPEPGTDFIFAVLGEELGFVGVFIVISLYLLFFWRGIRIAHRAPDVFGSLLAIGITSMIIIQVFINIGVVSATIPVTGITLPFISYGGSSLLIMLSGVGILLNISSNFKN